MNAGALSLPVLLARDPEVAPEVAALVLACDVDPSVDVQRWLARLDEMASPIADRISRCTTLHERVATLGTHFCETLGFQGNEENYYDSRNSHLPWVIEQRRGIPISLAVVYMALARRVGVPAHGVGFPGHFLVRAGDGEGLLIDAFFGARVVEGAALDDLSRRVLGGPGRVRAEHLQRVDARAISVRMLYNLKGVYEAVGEHTRALVVCDRLVDLTGAPEHRRDRGRHALALGAHAAAIDDLQRYLQERPEASDAGELRTLLARLRAESAGRALQ